MHYRKLGLAGLIGGTALLLLVLLLLGTPAGLSRLEAEQLWLQQQPARYQLMVAQQTATGTCDQESLVDNLTRQATNLSNDCRNPIVWTVPRLFSWIAELEHTQVRCYPTDAMCACRTTLRTSVHYDPEQGFPREVIYEWRKWPNLLSPAYYRSRFDQSFPGCDKDGVGGQVVFAISLTDQP